MKVLIVESKEELGFIWQRHLERQGMEVVRVATQEDAITHLTSNAPEIIILDLVLDEGSALAISDFANYRHPDTRVIFVTNTTFFSDGSIFNHAGNACAFVQSTTSPDDLAAMVEHYAAAS
ncbi:MAG: response regulator [Pseudomonadota bacterium]